MSTPVAIDSASPGTNSGGTVGRRQMRDLWAIEQRRPFINLAQAWYGKLLLAALCAVLAKAVGAPAPAALIAAVFAYFPRYRNWIIASAALAVPLSRIVRHPETELEAVATVLATQGLSKTLLLPLGVGALITYYLLAVGALLLVRQNKQLFLARRPVITMIAIAAALCALASSPLLNGLPSAALWTFLTIFIAYMWFLAYALIDQRSRGRSPLLFQVGILHPFWGSTWTPFGKGAAYLRKHQAKTDEELAVTQLKGFKLLTWSLFLLLLRDALTQLFEKQWGLPTFDQVLSMHMQSTPYPILLSWGSMTWATVWGTMSLAIWGHQIIGFARLAGFRLQRNTWRPLEARSVAEFWNRYYFYFKELLVEFFFFPTFLKFFRDRPRLRVFFATFVAAGIGNAIYHVFSNMDLVATYGFQQVFRTFFISYMFYCLVLSLSIGISQLRLSSGRKLPTSFIGSLRAIFGVWALFVCLHVFIHQSPVLTFWDRCLFLLSLFGYQS